MFTLDKKPILITTFYLKVIFLQCDGLNKHVIIFAYKIYLGIIIL